jgi:hypothetical protein
MRRGGGRRGATKPLSRRCHQRMPYSQGLKYQYDIQYWSPPFLRTSHIPIISVQIQISTRRSMKARSTCIEANTSAKAPLDRGDKKPSSFRFLHHFHCDKFCRTRYFVFLNSGFIKNIEMDSSVFKKFYFKIFYIFKKFQIWLNDFR